MKNETKHTPGPWEIVETDTAEFAVIAPLKIVNYGGGEEPEVIAAVPGNSPRLESERDEQEANARLIAAAPELLSALNECIGIICNESNLTETACKGLDTARAITRKAEGK